MSRRDFQLGMGLTRDRMGRTGMEVLCGTGRASVLWTWPLARNLSTRPVRA